MALLPLKDYTVNEDNIYAEIQEELSAGYTAPFIYSGWENVIVGIGETMLSYIKGESELEDIVASMDGNQHLIWDNAEVAYTTFTEKIRNGDCARLIGIGLAKASGADFRK